MADNQTKGTATEQSSISLQPQPERDAWNLWMDVALWIFVGITGSVAIYCGTKLLDAAIPQVPLSHYEIMLFRIGLIVSFAFFCALGFFERRLRKKIENQARTQDKAEIIERIDAQTRTVIDKLNAIARNQCAASRTPKMSVTFPRSDGQTIRIRRKGMSETVIVVGGLLLAAIVGGYRIFFTLKRTKQVEEETEALESRLRHQ